MGIPTNLFLQSGFLSLYLGEALDECLPLLTFCLETFDLQPQFLQLSLTYLQSL